MGQSNKTILLPDIGTADAVDVIEIAVKPGDQVQKEDTLITLESDKASMDVPSEIAGTVVKVLVKVGDKVKQGDPVAEIEASDAKASTNEKKEDTKQKQEKETEIEKEKTPQPKQEAKPAAQSAPPIASGNVYAGPAVRRLAYQLGVDLTRVSGTGNKGRITQEDVHQFVKQSMASGGGSGLGVLPWPDVDFSQFGEVEVTSLSRIKKKSGANLHRNWVMIPHVTQFEDADITELEAFRKANKASVEKQGAKLTPLVFIMKAAVAALKKFPSFNASLSKSGEELVYKHYFHIGVAVDTPNGLLVPVIRNVDQKGFSELAIELKEISEKAREGKLKANDMQGGSFSISSLGGIGGTAFTPIINAPEVAILGVSRSVMKPQWDGETFKPRLMLPLSLSYDHRVIDGAQAARFIVYLSECLSDLRRILL